MSAVAREIAFAFESHPKNKFDTSTKSRRILVSSSDANDKENDTFFDNLKTVMSSKYDLNEIKPIELINKKKNLEEEKCYDGAILSNILTSEKVVNDNEKIAEILSELLGNLKPGGVAVIRENFEDYSAQIIAEMTKFLDVFAVSKSNEIIGFEFYGMNQLQDSIYGKSNFLDVFWTLSKKTETRSLHNNKLSTFREFLDQTQYTEDNVKSYEWIFGENFISPGGINENRRILKYFNNLQPGKRMLDIGVGIGGGARQAAKEYGVHVLGCDLSSNMILHAFDRNQRDKDHRVEFQIADATVYSYAQNSFDAVFSRDCVQHIPKLDALIADIYKWLKPGGELLITMYGKGYGTLKPKFLQYVKDRQYYLHTIKDIYEFAKAANFKNIYTENMTQRFKEILLSERQKAIDNKAEFVEKFSEELFDKLIKSWADKLEFIENDNHNWLLLKAEKPY